MADKRGGLSFIRKLVDVIKRRGGIESNKDVIEAFSEAAGEDLSVFFGKMGIYSTMPLVENKICKVLKIN